MSGEAIVILVTVVFYMIVMLVIGFRMSSQVKGLDDYMLAGRNLPWYVLTLTFSATVANTATVMGHPGFAYEMGITYVFWASLASATTATLLLSRIGARLRSLRLSTISDLAVERFQQSRRLEILISIWQVGWAVFVVALSLFGVALILEVVTGVAWVITIFPIAIVTILYTMAGGLRAVVLTDTLQMLIIILGVSALFFVMTIKYGTFTTFISQYVGNTGFDLQPAAEGLTLFAGFTDLFTLPPGETILGLVAYIIATSFWIPIDLGFIQRSLAAKDMKHSRKGVYSFIAIDWANAWTLLGIGIFGAILIPGLTNTDEVVIRLVREFLPTIGAAIVVAAVVAAAMSTISTYLNAGSSILTHNIVLKMKPTMSEKSKLRYGRVFTVLIGLLALLFGPFISASGIIVAAVSIQMILITALAPLVLLALFWKRMSEQAAFWGCVIASVVTLGMIIHIGGPWAAMSGSGYFGIPVMFWSLALSLALYIGISLFQEERPEQISEACRKMFSTKQQTHSNKDIFFFSVIWLSVILIGIVKKQGIAFPFLSGPFAWVTDAFFISMACFTVVFSSYLTGKVFRFVRQSRISR